MTLQIARGDIRYLSSRRTRTPNGGGDWWRYASVSYNRITGALIVTLGDGVVLEHVLERVVDVAEGGPVGRVPLPAAAHQLVDGGGAARRALHTVALQPDSFCVTQPHTTTVVPMCHLIQQ